MSKTSPQESGLADVYAQAMLNLAGSDGQSDVLHEEWDAIVKLLGQQPDLGDYLANPSVSHETKQKSLEKMFRGRLSDLMVDSIQVMNRKNRLGLLESVAVAFRAALEERRNLARVSILTATPLGESLRIKIIEAARKQTGKEVELVERVDPTILGGMIIQIGDQKFDSSVMTRLRTVAHSFAQRASREIHAGSQRYLEGRLT